MSGKSKRHRGRQGRERSRNERNRKAERQGPVWLFGLHAVAQALDNPDRRFERLLVTEQARTELENAFGPGLPFTPETVTRRDLEPILPPGAVHQGAALLTHPLDQPDFEDLLVWDPETDPAPLIVMLDQATDPRNVGAVMRSAAAFGARGVVLPERHAPEATGVLAKAASGALEEIALVHVTNLARALETAKKEGFWIAGLDGKAEEDLRDADLGGPMIIVLGSEGAGLRRLTAQNCDRLVKIGIGDAVESLNLSAAAAIVLHAASRI